MANRQTLRNFFSLFNKQCVRMELQFNDGTSTIYSDADFLASIVNQVRNNLAKDIQSSVYCKEPKKVEKKAVATKPEEKK